MIEEFIKGPQLSTESIVYKGKCYTIAFSDRNYEFLQRFSPHIIENGGDIPSSLDNKILIKVNDLIEKSALSLGVDNCVVKGDIVIKNEKPYIIELALRLSGGYFSTTQIPISTGVDLIGIAIKIACGEKVDDLDLVIKYRRFLSTRYFFPKPGKLKNITGIKNLKNNKNVVFSQFFVKKGDFIQEPTAHTSRVGVLIAQGRSRKQASQLVKNAMESVIFDYEE